MDSVVDVADASKALDLSWIRFQLMYGKTAPLTRGLRLLTPCRSRLEDTITFHLIERVQFALNKVSSARPLPAVLAC